jgi:hypothetical protein
MISLDNLIIDKKDLPVLSTTKGIGWNFLMKRAKIGKKELQWLQKKTGKEKIVMTCLTIVKKSNCLW